MKLKRKKNKLRHWKERKGLNRKAIFSEFWEMILVLVGYMFVVLLSMLFVGSMQADVEAHVEAQNARFACKHNIAMFAGFQASENKTFDEFLVESYAANDFSAFESQTTKLLNTLIGSGAWELTVLNSTTTLSTIGHTAGEDTEKCITRTPVPCRGYKMDCELIIKMEQKY